MIKIDHATIKNYLTKVIMSVYKGNHNVKLRLKKKERTMKKKHIVGKGEGFLTREQIRRIKDAANEDSKTELLSFLKEDKEIQKAVVDIIIDSINQNYPPETTCLKEDSVFTQGQLEALGIAPPGKKSDQPPQEQVKQHRAGNDSSVKETSSGNQR
jgi:hypothetical protein